MDRFDRFSERARNVLTLAQDEAQRFGHNYIGTEHLLLGLVREGEGVAARVLENMHMELARSTKALPNPGAASRSSSETDDAAHGWASPALVCSEVSLAVKSWASAASRSAASRE
jgi:ATP-dependent Clp protease ATP-binding subunit ClpA